MTKPRVLLVSTGGTLALAFDARCGGREARNEPPAQPKGHLS